MFTYTMRYSLKDQPFPVIIKVKCEGLVEAICGFNTIPEAFEWLEQERKKYQ